MKGPATQQKIQELRSAAESYARADKALEQACGEQLDPIACTVFALKKRPGYSVLPESAAAASGLESVVALHRELVEVHGMDTDAVRAIWFPILNHTASDD